MEIGKQSTRTFELNFTEMNRLFELLDAALGSSEKERWEPLRVLRNNLYRHLD
jgi:hypothetical protein